MEKIWQPKKQNGKAEWINNISKELKVLEEGQKVEINIDLLKSTLKNIKLENAAAWWNTCFLVQEIHFHSGQTSSRYEHMLTRRTGTWMEDQKKEHIDQEKPKERNRAKQLQTCQLMKCKILTAQVRDKIYYSLTSRGLFLEEKKGCRKGSRSTEGLF